MDSRLKPPGGWFTSPELARPLCYRFTWDSRTSSSWPSSSRYFSAGPVYSLLSVHAVARPTMGAVVFPIGLLVAAVVLWPHPLAFSYAALMLAGPDAAAGIVGQRVAGVTWTVPGGEKSALGSLTFFVVAFALGIAFALATGSGAIAGAAAMALAVTAVEAVLSYGLDNLFIPAVAGLLGEQWLRL